MRILDFRFWIADWGTQPRIARMGTDEGEDRGLRICKEMKHGGSQSRTEGSLDSEERPRINADGRGSEG